MLMSLKLLGKRLFPFHVAKLDIFLQTGYLVCFASFVICKKATFLAKKWLFVSKRLIYCKGRYQFFTSNNNVRN